MKVTAARVEEIRVELHEMGENGIDAETAWNLARELLKAVDERSTELREAEHDC